MPVASASWKPSLPIMLRATLPVMNSVGTESIIAFWTAVTRFVAPGPEVASAQPRRPLARA